MKNKKIPYDCLAKKYNSLWLPDNYLVKEYKKILKKIKSPQNTLDYGCGTGSFSKKLNLPGEIIGVDISKEMLKKYCLKFPEKTYILGDMRKVKLKQSFDLIICTDDTVNHLLKDSQWIQFLKNVKEHLAPNGYFLFDAHTLKKMELLKQRSPFKIKNSLIEIKKIGERQYSWLIKSDNNLIEVSQYIPSNEKILRLTQAVFSKVEDKPIFDEESKLNKGRIIYICS